MKRMALRCFLSQKETAVLCSEQAAVSDDYIFILGFTTAEPDHSRRPAVQGFPSLQIPAL